MAALTKAELSSQISRETGLNKSESTKALEAILGIIKQSLESGEDVLISSFGKFCVKEKRVRRGRNPQTGSDLQLDARRVVTYKCSSVLRRRINGE